MANKRTRFVASSERPSVTYGPTVDAPEDAYVLAVTTKSEGRIEVKFDTAAMYDLWTEVKGTPWPERDLETGQKDRLVRQVLHAANGADEEMLREALDVLGAER
ncbi:hypothetical protein [Haloarcula amylovorans]|uniref:hypothetical protein n=1 Tax=Haloarcula amylovorans TaxID=2562280 RepID=UPI001076042D|nr:hypothetical protein [Halomicroarcula amylolytica]